jgi:hypothetical protein
MEKVILLCLIMAAIGVLAELSPVLPPRKGCVPSDSEACNDCIRGRANPSQ